MGRRSIIIFSIFHYLPFSTLLGFNPDNYIRLLVSHIIELVPSRTSYHEPVADKTVGILIAKLKDICRKTPSSTIINMAPLVHLFAMDTCTSCVIKILCHTNVSLLSAITGGGEAIREENSTDLISSDQLTQFISTLQSLRN